ncbi:response regulator [Prosthecomicrobium pneumaticum]|uniref:DNA-binding NtrC family response regulator n=1 Tax=Prosthecomicrobium pneumaticum TaxID=81895 RepID=A0A7W9L2Y1_9HYPH|nr:response regulator [Prosthecomicrobium pneumaticum]MBB5753968.1 DNA-binding NtrC family response regulator [Prosthecomicrobium pneumaticum]
MTSTGRAASPLAGLRVLLVEDDFLIAMELEDAVVDFDCTVVGPYGRLGEALEAVAHEAIDGAVVDLNLRGESSLPLIERLQAAGVPVIVSSGYVELPTLQEQLAVLPKLPKPLDAERLRGLMVEHFRGTAKAGADGAAVRPPSRSEAGRRRP